ncbi:hypothetical protein U1Q18_044182 [Sarracenia purpurea var. burkii]
MGLGWALDWMDWILCKRWVGLVCNSGLERRWRRRRAGGASRWERRGATGRRDGGAVVRRGRGGATEATRSGPRRGNSTAEDRGAAVVHSAGSAGASKGPGSGAGDDEIRNSPGWSGWRSCRWAASRRRGRHGQMSNDDKRCGVDRVWSLRQLSKSKQVTVEVRETKSSLQWQRKKNYKATVYGSDTM